MGFLSVVSALVEGVSECMSFPWYNIFGQRRALNQLDQHRHRLTTEVNVEGAKILSYLEFDRLISQIRGSINTIVENDKRIEPDDLFWEIMQPTHGQLHQAVNVNLNAYDVSNFDTYHQGLVNGAKPLLIQQIQHSEALFRTRQRQDYLYTLQQALPPMGQLEGFAIMIIERVARNLANYGRR